MIVFCSDSHTAKGHVAIGNSAERLLEGGRTAIAVAPVDLAETGRQRHRADRRHRRRRRRRARDRRCAGRRARRDRRAGRQRGHRPARRRLPRRRRAGQDLAELLRGPPDRDRDLAGARAPARGHASRSAAAQPPRRPPPAPARAARLRRAGAVASAQPVARRAHRAPSPWRANAPARSSAPPSRCARRPVHRRPSRRPAGERLGTGAHAGARYRGGRAGSADDKAHRARGLPRAAAGRGALDRGRGPHRAQGPAARARPQAAGVPPRQGPARRS